VQLGRLSAIRWVIPKKALSAKAAKNPIARALAATGVPEPPHDMSVHEEARFLLEAAAEIEQALLVQYLYAYYSLDLDNSVAAKWAAPLRDIAVQEMAHLITVQNLLLAIGEEPYLDRGQLHKETIPFELKPFGEVPLARFITTESPLPDNIPPAKQALCASIKSIAIGGAPGSGPLTIERVGSLYIKLYWLFLPTDTTKGPWTNFPAESGLPPNRHLTEADFTGLQSPLQALPNEFRGKVTGPRFVCPVRSAKPSAPDGPLQPIFQISMQGEGAEDTVKSHFNRFLALWQPMQQLIKQGQPVTLNVPINPSPDPSRPGTRTISNPAAALWANLFNVRYQMLILKIWLALSKPSDDSDTGPAGRAALCGQAIDLEMMTAITSIANKLTSLPLKPRPATPVPGPMEMAGPPFELPDDALPNRPKAQCQRLLDLIDQAAKYTAGLQALPASDPDRPTQADLDTILKPLGDDDSQLKPALQTLLQNFP
jgi:hypothetical protein